MQQKKSYSNWSEQENRKILQFVIADPNALFQQSLKYKTIPLLASYIQSDKNQQTCYDKIRNLLRNNKSAKQLISFLRKPAKVDQKWISERIQASQFFRIEQFEDKINSIREKFTFEEKALRIFISRFNLNEALANKNLKQSQIMLKTVPFQQKHPQKDQPKNFIDQRKAKSSTFSSQILYPELPEYIETLRYVIFLEKYKKQLEKNKQIIWNSNNHRIANFIQTKDSQIWRNRHSGRLATHAGNVENLIKQYKKNLYVKKEQFEKEIARVNASYQNDFEKQLNAFHSNPKLLVGSPDEQIEILAEKISNEVNKKIQPQKEASSSVNSNQENQQESLRQQDMDFSEANLQKYVIQYPIKFNLIFQREQNEKQTIQKSLKIVQKAKQIKEKSSQQQNLSKKQKLQQKNIDKSYSKNTEVKSQPIYSPSDSQDQQQVLENSFERTVGKNLLQYELSECNSNKNFKLDERESNKVSQMNQKSQKPQFWTISQRMKALAFFSVNKQTFLSGDVRKKYNIHKKFASYIGTRSLQKCRSYSNWFKGNHNYHNYDLEKAIQEEGKKLGFTQNILQELRNINKKYSKQFEIDYDQFKIKIKCFPQIITNLSSIRIEEMIKQGPQIQILLEAKNQKTEARKEQKKLYESSEAVIYNVNLQIPKEFNVKEE